MTTEEIHIRVAVPADTAPMALVIERANAGRDGLPLPITPGDPETHSDIEEKMAKVEAWTYVASVGGQVVGLVLGYPATETGYTVNDPNAEYLALLMVDPSNWGQRIASRLVDTAATHARSQGKCALFLWTRDENNERARTFYEHKGFDIAEEVRVSEKRGPQVQYLMNL